MCPLVKEEAWTLPSELISVLLSKSVLLECVNYNFCMLSKLISCKLKN